MEGAWFFQFYQDITKDIVVACVHNDQNVYSKLIKCTVTIMLNMTCFLLAKGIQIPSLVLRGNVVKSLSQDTRNIISFITQEQMEIQLLLAYAM